MRPVRSTSSIAATIASCASRSRPAPLPKSSINAADQIIATGFAMNCRDVGRGAVHGFEQRRKLAVGVQVRRRRDADRARTGRPEIRQDVAEQVRRDDDVEAVRLQHEARAQDVDVLLVDGDVGIAFAISAVRASHHGMLIAMPLLFVATVRRFARRWARSNANFSTRSVP